MHKHHLKLAIISALLEDGFCECLPDKAPEQSSAGDPGRMQRGDEYHRSGTMGERQFSASVANTLAEQNYRDTLNLRLFHSQLDSTLTMQSHLSVSEEPQWAFHRIKERR